MSCLMPTAFIVWFVGGRNGYGAKLCNIFSKKFSVSTASKDDGKKFKQVSLTTQV